MDNSDFNKKRTNLYDLLPEVYKSDTNKSVFENIFNRYLTKSEFESILGIVGQSVRGARIDRRIQEDDIHRQAYQLQPLLYKKVATVEHIASYQDMLHELERVGVDPNTLPKWGNTLHFNFAPPIDLDKIINYSDYYWYDADNPNSDPQYITIKSFCTVAEARLHQKRQDLANFGSSFPIVGASADDDYIKLIGNLLELFEVGQQFEIINSTVLDGTYTIADVSIDGAFTKVKVTQDITDISFIDGEVSFENILRQLRADVACACYQSSGWDTFGWDDNFGTPPEETYLWDYTPACSVLVNAWSKQNKWIHKADIPSGAISISTRATMPIIEYNSTLELNEWSFTDYRWQYRKSTLFDWADSDEGPTLDEMNNAAVVTSKGDTWLGFTEHWLFIEQVNTLPVNRQVENTTTVVDDYIVPEFTTQDTFALVNGLGVALGGFDDIRVYVENERVYGTYAEIVDGSNFVTGIQFFTAKPGNSIIRIEVHASALEDAGKQAIAVRVDADDTEFGLNGTTNRSLVRYRKTEQVKTEVNQYPQFDIYRVDGTTAYRANPIFKFKESSDSAIDARVNRRIKIVDDGRNWIFEQMLLDEDNGRLYCYKDSATIEAKNPTGLQTIWKKGLNDEEYVPRYVNKDRIADGEEFINEEGDIEIASVPFGGGDWEIPNQLYYNAAHENRKEVKLSELLSHFQSIVASQEAPVGFSYNQEFPYRLITNVNYGVGGLIKEHNDSYDTMLSAMLVNTNTPESVIQYAHNAYETAINLLKEYYRANVTDFLLNSSQEFIIDLESKLADEVISAYELNDSANFIFGDSNTYDEDADTGVRSWPATLPFVQLGLKVLPLFMSDSKRNISELLHHDGHQSTLTVQQQIVNNIHTSVVNTILSPGRKRGWKDDIPADGGIVTTRAAVDWTRLLINDYWLDPDGSFYRFEVVSISALPPSSSVPDGTLWLRDVDGMLMYRDSLSLSDWTPVSGIAGDVSSGWKFIDISELFMNVIREVETRLHESAPQLTTLSFDINDYIIDQDDEDQYNINLEEMFNQYTRTQRIADPYITDYGVSDAFTWNYKNVDVNNLFVNFPNATVDGQWAPRWYTINEKCFGTEYPHLMPWRLQGYSDKPSWWDSEYLGTGRRWSPLMWTNVMGGIIPITQLAPDNNPGTGSTGQVTEYDFVSVNITNDTTTDGYGPDDLLPPYWVPPTSNPEDVALEDQVFIRNISAVPQSSIGNKYVFGDIGPVEWAWRKSSQFLYDQLKIAFRMQPVRFLHYTWGTDFIEVGGLQIDELTEKVYSHVNAIFHGDVIDQVPYIVDGINQWYVNSNRFSNFDAKNSDFREVWTGWTAQLTYQFGAYMDTKSFEIDAPSYDIGDHDYNLTSKRSPGFDEVWLDALKITIADYGGWNIRNNVKVPKGDAADWTFLIDAPIPVSRIVNYYGVYNYTFVVTNQATGTCQTPYDNIPWETGDMISLSTSDSLPDPLLDETTYYIIKDGANEFRFAETLANALATTPVAIVLTDDGYGQHYIEENERTFFAYGGINSTNGWKRHKVDTDSILTTLFPMTITGLQNVVDFIDGYSEYLIQRGFVFNDPSGREVDPNTGRLVNWQTEIERFIHRVYEGLGVGNVPTGKYTGRTYHYTLNPPTDEITLTGNPQTAFSVGDEVVIFSTGTVPTPLQLNTPYYIIPEVSNNEKKYKLATTYQNAIDGIFIDITSPGTGVQSIGHFVIDDYEAEGFVELNPFRNAIWFRPEFGVLSNVIEGPYEDIRVEQTIYDQYGRPIDRSAIKVFREDKLSQIRIDPNIPNDVNTETLFDDYYNNLHFGGMHLFTDGYEHVIIFNDYSSEGALIYDPFVGLNTPRFLMQFERQPQKLLRPSVGGYYQHDNNLIRNIEASVEDMQQYYGTYDVSESADFISYARDLLGYIPPGYLDQLNTNKKSKFVFWKGLIQNKGSINSIKAFINSAHFVDARVDEFWAYQVAEYGDAREQTYPAIKLIVEDTENDDLKLHFTGTDAGDTIEDRFTELTFADEGRWVNLPDLRVDLGDMENLYFETEVTEEIRQTVILTERVTTTYPFEGVQIIDETTSTILVEGVHYRVINSRVIEFDNFAGDVAIFTLNPNKKKFNPTKVIDTKSKTVIKEVPIWDPARGHHYHQAIHVIDIQQDTDPVDYTSDVGWINDRIGTTWLDTSQLEYVPYYDNKIFPNIDNRIRLWGRLADYASVDMYEWTQSNVPPAEWADKVLTEEGDTTIDTDIRASGIAKEFLFELDTGTGEYNVVNDISQNYIVAAPWNPLNPIGPVTIINLATGTYQFDATAFNDGVVEVYVNGVTQGTALVSSSLVNISGLDEKDFVHIIQRIVPTDEELTNGDYKYDYQYHTSTKLGNDGVTEETTYYFWVKSKAVRSSGRIISLREAEAQLAVIPIPYQFFRNIRPAENGIPNRYTQVVLRNIIGLIDTNDRYILRFTRDFVLRSDLNDGPSAVNLKNIHREWTMFRQNQPQHVPTELWTKLIEAVVGNDLDELDLGNYIPIPTLDRVLYDITYGTVTRFGLGDGQAFGDKDELINVIQSILTNQDFDPYPINKETYLNTYTFDTPENIKVAMEYIYNNFPSEHVNQIFFACLHDSLSRQPEYSQLLKTSMIALHGIRILETVGNINDDLC